MRKVGAMAVATVSFLFLAPSFVPFVAAGTIGKGIISSTPIKPRLRPPSRGFPSTRSTVPPSRSGASSFGSSMPHNSFPGSYHSGTVPTSGPRLGVSQDPFSARIRYGEQTSRFAHASNPAAFSHGAHDAVFKKVGLVPTTYHQRREAFYTRYAFVPPIYAYQLYPYYGIWDSVFLEFALDRIAERQYAAFYYNHQEEEGLLQWRQELDRLAAENDELRDRLAMMDREVAKLEGTPRDPYYVPEDVKDIAFAPEVVELASTQDGNTELDASGYSAPVEYHFGNRRVKEYLKQTKSIEVVKNYESVDQAKQLFGAGDTEAAKVIKAPPVAPSAVGNNFNENNLRKMQPGRTTEIEAIQLLGSEPVSRTYTETGGYIARWQYVRVVGTTVTDNKSIDLLFEKDKTLIRLASSSNIPITNSSVELVK